MARDKPRKKAPNQPKKKLWDVLATKIVDNPDFEVAWQSIMETYKPKVRKAWTDLRLKAMVLDPLTLALGGAKITDPVFEALYTNDEATELVSSQNKAYKKQQQEKREAESSVPNGEENPEQKVIVNEEGSPQ